MMREQRPNAVRARAPGYLTLIIGGASTSRGQVLSVGSRSGNRPFGSSVMRVIARPPKSRLAANVRLPGNQTSTGYVTTAVFASSIWLLDIGLIVAPVAANSTFRITGEGIWPF